MNDIIEIIFPIKEYCDYLDRTGEAFICWGSHDDYLMASRLVRYAVREAGRKGLSQIDAR